MHTLLRFTGKINLTGISILIWLTAGSQTVGLIQYEEGNTDGYVLFSPIPSTSTYLIDKCGEKIHEWQSEYRPGMSCYLLPDGSLLRPGITNNPIFTAGGSGGIIERYNWEGELIWSYVISDATQCQHHDIRPMPNGHILVIAWDLHTDEEALTHGRNPDLMLTSVWSEKIIEIEPVGTNQANIVWEWKLWDHLVQDFDQTKLNYGNVAEHPGRMDLNYVNNGSSNPDWVHINSIDYNEELDQIIVSCHNMHEIWVIDHSTTTTEAATHSGGQSGKGGDILYRWGNPQVYDRGTPDDKQFYAQHHATWIPSGFPDEGKILVFNNGLNRPEGNYSSVDIIDPPLDESNHYLLNALEPFAPAELFWTYTAPIPTDFYGANVSGVYPLADGSFFITTGPKGTMFEINSNEETVWKYINPVNNFGVFTQGETPFANLIFRGTHYPPNYPAFEGVNLEPQGALEFNPTDPPLCEVAAGLHQASHTADPVQCYPNPVVDFISIHSDRSLHGSQWTLIDLSGRQILAGEVIGSITRIDVSALPTGLYTLRMVNLPSYSQLIRKE